MSRFNLRSSDDLLWMINRLACMMPGEFPYRIRRIIQSRLEQFGLGMACNPPQPRMGKTGRAWVPTLPRQFDHRIYTKASEDILGGRFNVFALRSCEIGFPPEWRRDPRTGKLAPLVFGKALNYKDQRLVGNIKYLWEINRHLELVTLAQAWHLTRNKRYAQGAGRYLSSWFNQNPYPLGPNWAVALEPAIRLTNWAIAWHLLGGDDGLLFKLKAGGRLRQKWLQSIYQHCHFIDRNLSLYSSANNHLLGELMGLYIAAVTWPLWPQSQRWRKRALSEFESQALLQNTPDGVNREQAFYYHHAVADMMIIVWRFAEANGDAVSRVFRGRLEAMLAFLATLMDINGNIPMVGDADDALMIRFSQEPLFCPFRSLLATGAILFHRDDFPLKAGKFDDKSRWILGDAAQQSYHGRSISVATAATGPKSQFVDTPTNPEQARRSFPEGGYWIMGCRLDQPNEIRMVIDAGPLGYLPTAAHGHADALALHLSVDGKEMLIDPGTYCYLGQPQWRNYFRGTSAHNTLRIDERDQSLNSGPFTWRKHARTKCVQWVSDANHERLVVSHDGYRRLADPVSHHREFVMCNNTETIEIKDKLNSTRHHALEIFWHCHEKANVVRTNGKILINRRNVFLEMSVSNPMFKPAIVSGQVAPPLGWVSRRFDDKQPCPVVIWRANCGGNVEVTTVIKINISP